MSTRLVSEDKRTPKQVVEFLGILNMGKKVELN